MTWFFKSGVLARDEWDVVVDASIPGWKHTGLRVGKLNPAGFELPANDEERIVFALEGDGLEVEYLAAGSNEWQRQVLRGRATLFSGPTDMLYLPRDTAVRINGSGRVAVGSAPAIDACPVAFMPADEVPVFVRGAGSSSRQVHNFGVPESLNASRLIVCEVVVPAGNWSGIPPHKHDTYVPGIESNLEEIYYFETAVAKGFPAPLASDPVGYLRAYASDERPIEITTEVRSGDVGLIPYGWHGPAMAAPGYDLYFFNVMAGPDPDRAWNITDDPNHAWIRQTWHHEDADPRLPYTAE